MNLKDYADWSPFSLRLVAGIIFVMAGMMKMSGIAMFAEMLTKAGFPLANVLAWIVAFVEVLGGLALLSGFWLRKAAVLLGIVMLVAFFVTLSSRGLQAALYPLSLLAAMVSLFLSGAGKASLQKA